MTCMGNKPRDVYGSGEEVFTISAGKEKKKSSVVAVQKGSSVCPDVDAPVCCWDSNAFQAFALVGSFSKK